MCRPIPTHPPCVYTRRQLMELVWEQSPFGDMRTNDARIACLRRKLGLSRSMMIRTVRQVGYAFDSSPAAALPATQD
ncbi:helix-turn-helix domain-containing protein [Streptomyces violascens]|uniref:helix-turn-helix domain-containing protein n=1 Tax=Streptomyces violascens TaxID=67381 RepID=UPI0037AF260B